jgi:anti-sigma-K factor RskA
MSDMPDDLDMLAAEYVLGTLEGADLDRARALESSAEDFRRAVARWRAHFLALDETAAALSPPPALWDKIEAQVVAALRVATSRQSTKPAGILARLSRSGLWGSLAFWRPAALAASFASLMLAAGLIIQLRSGPESPIHVAVLTTGQGKPAAVVNVYADGTTEFVPLEAVEAPEGRVIEIWTLQNPQQGPTSIGKLSSARRIRLNLENLRKPEANHLFELTLEPLGGSPTGKPTGPVLMKGLAIRSI